MENEKIVENTNPSNKLNNTKKRRFHIKGSSIFVFVMLFYPVAHFLLMWFGVNINSILLTFQKIQRGKLVWVGMDNLFYNYETLFMQFKTETTQSVLAASGIYFIISCLVTLPIALFFSYFIFKKILGNGFFKIIFFIPSILPLVILTLVFSLSFSPQGLMEPVLNGLGLTADVFIGDSAKWMVWLFCIWAGIGYDVILLTSGMSRIPRDVLESCKMDGVPPMVEFFKIIIPLTWPTITTLFIFGMMSVFNVYLQPMFLTQGQYDTMTIGLQIYQQSGGTALNEPATLGLFCSLVATPIILTTRWGLNKIYGDVNY
jgi:ABC-type sugar transport system permease subunit